MVRVEGIRESELSQVHRRLEDQRGDRRRGPKKGKSPAASHILLTHSRLQHMAAYNPF